MKNRKIILSVIGTLAGLIFIIGSTGVTVIFHSCHHCGDFSVKSGMFLSPEIPDDHCCEAAVSHHHSEGIQTFDGDCCHFRVDRMKLATFTPSEKDAPELPAEMPFIYILPRINLIPGVYSDRSDYHNKHGGKFMITAMCQLIS